MYTDMQSISVVLKIIPSQILFHSCFSSAIPPSPLPSFIPFLFHLFPASSFPFLFLTLFHSFPPSYLPSFIPFLFHPFPPSSLSSFILLLFHPISLSSPPAIFSFPLSRPLFIPPLLIPFCCLLSLPGL